MTPLRVLWYRLRAVCAVIPVAWRNYGDWNWAYPVALFAFKLRRLERVLRADNMHEGSEQWADQIRDMLKALDDHENASERFPFPISGSPLDYANRTDEERQKFRDWANAVDALEESSWDRAWEIFRQHGRCWWC